MNTYEMVKKSIEFKKSRGALKVDFIESIKSKLDVFLMANRVTEEEYSEILNLLGA